MNILVTGGAGFIGSRLVEELVNRGADVAVVDISDDENSYFFRQQLHKKSRFFKIDITDRQKITNFIVKNKFDYIYHLAAQAIVEKSYNDPYNAFETNVMGTVNVLEAVRKSNGIKGVIVASSDKAYGKTTKKYTEDSPLRGDHPYDVSKSCTDLISLAYNKTYNLPVVVTRFGNVYGEGDLHMDRIVPGICEAIIKKSTLKIRSDGTYVRDYLYVKDVVAGYVFLLEKIDQTKGNAYNFSSKDTYSVIELIKKAEKVLNVKIKYKIMNTAKNEIPYQHLDDTKIRKLGWNPKFSLKKSLHSIINWYKKVL
ncbi:SDR family NAD(P)-dependent oxidoreductase [Patescibacteria group bacterium]|nr:SDR family NAD(P)-dependent oxidoreductase [Patescibacteria group bacterium]